MKAILEALEEVVGAFEPLSTESVGLPAALGRVLGTTLHARSDLPPFDNSAMDGFAGRAADLDAGARLPVVGESRAGGPPAAAVLPGTVTRIFTGAPMPAGADTVLMQENATREEEGLILVREAPAPGAHVRRRGEDLTAGQPCVREGQVLGPGEIGLLASQGHGTVAVYRRPRVAILTTGDELRDLGAPLEPGTIVDSNAHALAAQAKEAGAEPHVLRRAGDRPEELAERIREGLEADVLVTVGGVSVGDYDLVHQALERQGVERRFWKVRIKPGKPLSFGVSAQGRPVVGLPGNPVSAMVTFFLFVRPGLRRMQGDRRPHPEQLHVRLGAPIGHRPGRTELVPVALADGDGGPVATPARRRGSGAVTAMAAVDALVVVPADSDGLPEGAVASALPLRPAYGGTRTALC